MDLQEWNEGSNWTDPLQDWDGWWAVVNAVMDLRVP